MSNLRSIRKAEDRDWNLIRELCCDTGSGANPVGADQSREDFGQLWIGPYQEFCPEWTYVVEDQGRIIGYLTGCPNTSDFVGKLPRGKFLENEIRVREGYSEEVRKLIEDLFPAHLHMNLDAKYRGKRLGDLLISRFKEDLRKADSLGIHIFCKQGPLSFYQRVGFRILAESEISSGKKLYVLVSEV